MSCKFIPKLHKYRIRVMNMLKFLDYYNNVSLKTLFIIVQGLKFQKLNKSDDEIKE